MSVVLLTAKAISTPNPKSMMLTEGAAAEMERSFNLTIPKPNAPFSVGTSIMQ